MGLFCTNKKTFYYYFKENMNDLGLPVPDGYFDTQNTAIATASAIITAIKTAGAGATMAEIAGATFMLEKLAVVGAVSASFYVGAVIGSIAVAAGKYLSCGSSILDFFAFAEKHNINPPWLREHMMKYPQIINQNGENIRKGYGTKARIVVA